MQTGVARPGQNTEFGIVVRYEGFRKVHCGDSRGDSLADTGKGLQGLVN